MIDIKSFLISHYPFIEISQIKLYEGRVSNENYMFISNSQKYVARVCLFEPENQVEAMVTFLRYAETVGYPASRIINTNDGLAYAKYNNSIVVVMKYIQGITAEHTTIDGQHILSLARLVAKFHVLEWKPTNTPITLDPDYIFRVYEEVREYTPSNGDVDILRLIELVDIYYEEFKEVKFTNFAKELPQGLTHGDINPGNVLFQDNKAVSLLDFEELGISWQLQDVAMILITWAFYNGAFRKDLINLFLKEYNSLRSITQIERDNVENTMKFIAFRQCVYAKRMLLQGRLKSLQNFSSYWALLYLHENKLRLEL